WLATGTKEFVIALFLTFGMCFLSSTFIVFLVNERSSRAKHLQFLSGANPINFWLATYLWDFFCYLIPCAIILIILAVAQVDILISNEQWIISFFLLVMHGWAVLPMMYAASFAFKTAAGAFVKVTIFNFVSGKWDLKIKRGGRSSDL